MSNPSAAEPKPGPAFMITHTTFRFAQATTVASMISFLLVLAIGLFVEEGPEILPPGWPVNRLALEALVPTLAGWGLGLLLLGPARTAQQVTLAGLLIRAAKEPGSRLVVPDPRGPVSRRPYLISMITAAGALLAAPAPLALSDQLGLRTALIIAGGILILAILAIWLLVRADRRWRATRLSLLEGQLPPESPSPRPAPGTRREQGRFRPVSWLYVLGTIALLAARGLRHPDPDRGAVRYGPVLESVVDWLVIIGGAMIVVAAVANLLVRLIRAIAGLITLTRLINAPEDPGRRSDPAPAAGDPAGQLCLVLIGFGVVSGEWLFALNRVSATPYPSLAGLSASLPVINSLWTAFMIAVTAAAALACRFASRTRNRLRGALSAA